MSKQTYQNLNKNMPLDVFAKLCADECLKLRKEVGELKNKLKEKDDEIEKLKRQIKLKDDADFQAIQAVKKEEMYQNMRKINQRLRDENRRLKKENDGMFEKLYNLKQINNE